MARYQFCVIIPFEFHRGLSFQCVQAWTDQQTVDRSIFQIIIAAPLDHPESEVEEIRPLLSDQDKFLRLPHNHDMDLAAAAVAEADADVLFFTEAHCLPKPDALERSIECFEQHLEWAGFSGRSIPITHNLLSEIEAEMYAADIERNLKDEGWLKALDQCLLVRTEAYEASGGIEPEFGHFAEWILAARFHLNGLELGYCPDVAIHHYYTGELDELIEFTVDFAEGKLRFKARGDTDPGTGLFPVIQRLEKYQVQSEKPSRYGWKRHRARLKVGYLSLRTRLALALKQKEAARKWFLKCMQRSISLGYFNALQELGKRN